MLDTEATLFLGSFSVLAAVVEEQFSALKCSKFFSLLINESTDISVKKTACSSDMLPGWKR